MPTKRDSRTMLDKVEHSLENTIFKSRWLLAPFFLGLIFSLVLLMIKFFQEFWHLATHVVTATEADVIVGILALVDMALVGSLLLMIIFSGYEIFISKIDFVDDKDRPDWMGKVDFSGLKLKVIGAIVAISAIDLLKSFMNIPAEMTDEHANTMQWKVIIHMTFVLSGVLFAVMDKVAGDTKKH
jgi:uncharacterized protein (TIGR00645 family)